MVVYDPDVIEFLPNYDTCEVLYTGEKDDSPMFMVAYKNKRPVYFSEDFQWEVSDGRKYDIANP